MTQGYGVGAIKALQDAGRPVVPVTAFSYNISAVTCVQTPGAKCILGVNPAYLSSEAIRLAVDILDGKSTSPKVVQLESPRLTNTMVNAQFSPGAKLEPIEIGKNAFPDEPPGLSLPVTPTWVDITAKEAAGS